MQLEQLRLLLMTQVNTVETSFNYIWDNPELSNRKLLKLHVFKDTCTL